MKYVGVALNYPLPIKGSSECAQNGFILALTFTLNFGHPHLQSLKQLSLSHPETTQKIQVMFSPFQLFNINIIYKYILSFFLVFIFTLIFFITNIFWIVSKEETSYKVAFMYTKCATWIFE